MRMKVIALDDSASMINTFDPEYLHQTISNFVGEDRFIGFVLDDQRIRPLGDFKTPDEMLQRVVFGTTRSRLWDSLTILITHLAKHTQTRLDVAVLTDGILVNSVFSNAGIVSKLLKRKLEDGWTFRFFDCDLKSWTLIKQYDRME